MSWDKNTTRSTKIDNTIEVLKDLNKTFNIPYTLEILGKVNARGQNDHYTGTEYYEIRKLSYGDYVILERMIRQPDCDIDDIITAEKFNKDNIPDNWEIEEEIGDLIGDITDVEENNEISGDRENLVCPKCNAPQNEIQEILQTNNPGFEWKCDNCGTKFRIKNTYKVIEIIGE